MGWEDLRDRRVRVIKPICNDDGDEIVPYGVEFDWNADSEEQYISGDFVYIEPEEVEVIE